MPLSPVSIGSQFGRLTVIAESAERIYGRRAWLCRCECGGEKVVASERLVQGRTRSCGCLLREHGQTLGKAHGTATGSANRTHGHRAEGRHGSRTYVTWQSMIQRCSNPRHKSYAYYGGRGITVCDRWRTFENFLADMGEKPDGLTIERVDNDAGYGPANCRWATAAEQNRNKRHRAASDG